jgi:hypothetical protein
MGIRRAVALAVLLPVLAPAVAGFAALAAPGHACTDHACRCAPRTAPKGPHDHCTGAERESSSCQMRGACRHDQMLLGAVPQYVLPAGPETRIAPPSGPAASTAVFHRRPGFSRLDLHPPRAL